MVWYGMVWLIDHSRPLKLVPLESLGAVSYSPSVVTVAVSVAVCEIFGDGPTGTYFLSR